MRHQQKYEDTASQWQRRAATNAERAIFYRDMGELWLATRYQEYAYECGQSARMYLTYVLDHFKAA